MPNLPELLGSSLCQTHIHTTSAALQSAILTIHSSSNGALGTISLSLLITFHDFHYLQSRCPNHYTRYYWWPIASCGLRKWMLSADLHVVLFFALPSNHFATLCSHCTTHRIWNAVSILIQIVFASSLQGYHNYKVMCAFTSLIICSFPPATCITALSFLSAMHLVILRKITTSSLSVISLRQGLSFNLI